MGAVSVRDRFEAELPEGFRFDARDLALLEVAQRIANRIDELEAALLSSGLVVAGSMGQERLNPLVPEIRLQQLALVRAMDGIVIPAEEQAERKSQRHVRAAQRRWERDG